MCMPACQCSESPWTGTISLAEAAVSSFETKYLPLGTVNIKEFGLQGPVPRTWGRLRHLVRSLCHSTEKVRRELEANVPSGWLSQAVFPGLVGVFIQLTISRCFSKAEAGAVINDNTVSSHRRDGR